MALTWNGPTSVVSRATDSSGISRPLFERTCSSDIAAGSLWNSGATRMITWYWLFGAKICDTCRVP